MDFYSLPRRTLQLLCKRNKIPANLTNIAMAQSLHSLQLVEDLDEILQQSRNSPVKTPTRPSNPPRSCRRNASLVISSLAKRRRVKKLKDEEKEEEEDDPLKNMPTLNTLVPCDEKSVCLKMYRREKCTPSVRRNSDMTFESEESAVGVVVEYVQVFEERRRSIGVQVDVEDITNGLLEIEGNRCVDLIKEGQETNSCLLAINDISDKECVESSGMQNVQVDYPLPEQSPKATNTEDTASYHVPILENNEEDLSGSVGIQNKNAQGDDINEVDGDIGLLEIEDIKKDQETNSCTLPINDIIHKECLESSGMQNVQVDDPLPELGPKTTNMTSNASIEDVELNHVSTLENNEDKLKGSVGIQSKNAEGDDMNKENEASKSDGGTEIEIKAEKQNKKKKDLDGLSLRKLRVLYKTNKEVIKSEKTDGEGKREEGEVKCEENKARLDGLSLRKLKHLYKNKVTKQY